MSTMDGGSSDWWIYLSVNNHVAPWAMVPWDTVVVIVVVVRGGSSSSSGSSNSTSNTQTMGTLRMTIMSQK